MYVRPATGSDPCYSFNFLVCVFGCILFADISTNYNYNNFNFSEAFDYSSIRYCYEFETIEKIH